MEEDAKTHQTGSQVTARTDGRTQRRRGEGPQTQLRAAAVSIPAACSSLQPRTLKHSLHLNAMLTTKAWSEKHNRHVSRASSGHCLPSHGGLCQRPQLAGGAYNPRPLALTLAETAALFY